MFCRIGDFYELFYEDAILVSRELQLTLTASSPNADVEASIARHQIWLETEGALPSGAPSALRARSRSGKPQLDLFGGASNAPAGPHPVVETIRNVDVDRLTPLDALKLIADLKKIASAS